MKYKAFSTARRQELESRYEAHLRTLPPERVRLLQLAPPDVRLMKDCTETVKQFQEEMAGRGEIDLVRSGVDRDRAYISVFVRAGVDVDTARSQLPEFFRGYIVRVHRS